MPCLLFHILFDIFTFCLICWFPHKSPKGPKAYLGLSWVYVLNEYFGNCEDIKLTQETVFIVDFQKVESKTLNLEDSATGRGIGPLRIQTPLFTRIIDPQDA